MSAQDDFFDFFEALLDPTPLVFASENGKRKSDPFITIQVSPGVPQPVHRGSTGEDGNRTVYAPRVVEVQIQAYGVGAWGALDALAMRAMTEAAQDKSEALNIGILSIDRLQSVPALVEGMKYEDRAILSLTANYVGAVLEEVGVIETIQGTEQVGSMPPAPFSAP